MTSIIKVDQIQLANGNTPTAADLGINTTGSVLQVLSATKTNTQNINGSSFVEISDLSVTITPSSSSSKILVIADVHYGSSNSGYPAFKLMRGTTHISVADTQSTGVEASFGHANNFASAEYRLFSAHHNYLDSPSTTSATTYSIQGSPMRTSSQTLYINRSIILGDENQMAATSTITVMEIAG